VDSGSGAAGVPRAARGRGEAPLPPTPPLGTPRPTPPLLEKGAAEKAGVAPPQLL
jgi:hypothetical protein